MGAGTRNGAVPGGKGASRAPGQDQGGWAPAVPGAGQPGKGPGVGGQRQPYGQPPGWAQRRHEDLINQSQPYSSRSELTYGQLPGWARRNHEDLIRNVGIASALPNRQQRQGAMDRGYNQFVQDQEYRQMINPGAQPLPATPGSALSSPRAEFERRRAWSQSPDAPWSPRAEFNRRRAWSQRQGIR